MTVNLDIDALRQWIGRTEEAQDVITPRLVKSLRATLDQDPGEATEGDAAPPAVHWCLAPPTYPEHMLGPDGHPTRGGFLPPVALPRRMWAGSKLEIVSDLRIGDLVERRSRISDVIAKEGRTGLLCFVTIDHEFLTARGTAIRETQQVVYRDIDSRPAPTLAADPTKPTWHKTIHADSVLLFRYSALTFNGHRIHYDRTYCIRQEGYPGLIVHGPLQATLLLMLAASIRGGVVPRHFAFRGINPLFDGADFSVNAVAEGDGLELWAANDRSQRTMTARAKW
jgi:3-methylfumaryl-CoA hydratase